MKKALPVKYVTKTRYADYYKVNGAFNVTHNVSGSHPFTCLDCRSNACEHIEAVQDYIAEHNDNSEAAA